MYSSATYTKFFNPGIYDGFVFKHWVDATADGVCIPLG